MKKKIFAISGSTRKHSSNGAILKFIAREYQAYHDIEIYEDLSILPHFNPDLDTDKPPVAVKTFREAIDAADAVIICSPEYVFSMPGSLKNAIEWTVSTTIFSRKPVAIIVAAASGNKAFESLDLVMTTIEASILKHSKLLIKGIKGKINEQGEIIDQHIRKDIRRLVDSLVKNIDL